ncbi:hypothetical protein OSTOST_16792 [Ostertagia ostertagi]
MLNTVSEWASSQPVEQSEQTSTTPTDDHDEGVMYVSESPQGNERLLSAALRSKMISLSKVADERVQQQMKKCIEMMRGIDVEVSSEIALHRPTPSRPHLARRVDLSQTGRPPNYAPIRLAKRATLKKRPEMPEQSPVEELNPDDIQCCVMCFRRIPDDGSDRDFDEWVKCSVCGLWAHESCSGQGTPCPYDEGIFTYSP